MFPTLLNDRSINVTLTSLSKIFPKTGCGYDFIIIFQKISFPIESSLALKISGFELHTSLCNKQVLYWLNPRIIDLVIMTV